MTDLRKAAEMALEALDGGAFGGYRDMVVETLRQALAQPEQEPWVKTYCGGKPNYCTPVDAVPGFTTTEPRQSLSRMKPGDRFILVRTSEIYHIKQDGSQWNETRQRPARLHKNSQVRLIVTHPKCDDACMHVCTEGFTKPPTCNTPVDAVNMSQDRVDETAKREHEPVAFVNGYFGGYLTITCFDSTLVLPDGLALYTAPPKREWVGLTRRELDIATLNLGDLEDCYIAIEAKLKEKNA